MWGSQLVSDGWGGGGGKHILTNPWWVGKGAQGKSHVRIASNEKYQHHQSIVRLLFVLTTEFICKPCHSIYIYNFIVLFNIDNKD